MNRVKNFRIVTLAAALAVFAMGATTANATCPSETCHGFDCDFLCPESESCGAADCCDPPDPCDCDGDGVCTICGQGSSNPNRITGTSGVDVICAKGGDDIISTLGGDDIIYAGNGDDTITAGNDDDVIFGEDGADDINAGSGDDVVDGGGGDDTIVGGTGSDVCDGKGGDDDVSDVQGESILIGGSGDDTLETTDTGSVGHDDDAVMGSVLCGGRDKDVLTGGGYGVQCLDPEGGQGTTGGADCTCNAPGTAADRDIHDVCVVRETKCRETSPSGLTEVSSCGC